MYTQRTGKYDKVDAYEDNDMLKGLLAQLDEEGNTKEGGIQVEAAVLMPAYMKNDDCLLYTSLHSKRLTQGTETS